MENYQHFHNVNFYNKFFYYWINNEKEWQQKQHQQETKM